MDTDYNLKVVGKKVKNIFLRRNVIKSTILYIHAVFVIFILVFDGLRERKYDPGY